MLLALLFAAIMVTGYSLTNVLAADHQAATSGAPESSRLSPDQPYCDYGSSDHAAITLSLYTGAAGSSVTIRGTGFTDSADVSVYWTEMSPSAGASQLLTSVTATVTGTFDTGATTVPPTGPAYPVGTYNITAADQYGNCGYASFSMTSASSSTPELTIEFPTSGIGGAETSVEGMYFTSGQTVDPIAMDGVDLSCTGGSPVVSDGSFDCDFTVPLALPAGDYPVTAHDSDDGLVTSSNQFDDTGGQTTTNVVCTPNSFGVSSVPTSIEYSTNCTATVSGDSPSGSVTWGSTSSTGTFFTWTSGYGGPEITDTDSCTLGDLTGACTISYSDTALGSPTITGSYLGDYENEPGSGSTVVTVTTPTASSIAVSCSPTQVTTTTECSAEVTGDSPTGTVSWSDNYFYPAGTFSSPTCTLLAGSCSVTYTPPTYPGDCTPEYGAECYYQINVTGTYAGDALNTPSSGWKWITATTLSSEYYSDTQNLNDGVLCSGGSGECTYEPPFEGGYGSVAAEEGGAESHSEPGPPPFTASGSFDLLSDSSDGEASLGGTAIDGGWASGDVLLGDSASVSGSCDMSSDSDNLAPCLDISASVDVMITGDCTGGADMNSCSYALGFVDEDLEECDTDSAGSECAPEDIQLEDCEGSDCDDLTPSESYLSFNPLGVYGCPEEDTVVCGGEGSFEGTYSEDYEAGFSSTADVESGDTLDFSGTVFGGVESSPDSVAGLDADPTITIANLDPSQLTVSTPVATMQAQENPSVLEVTPSILPASQPAGAMVTDNTTLMNSGSTPLTNVSAVGSLDGPLACPMSTLGAGDSEICTATFGAPPRPGAETDYVVANGTGASANDVFGQGTGTFNVLSTPYAVKVAETGLPAGTLWQYIANGTLQRTTGTSITVLMPYGDYPYEIVAPPGYFATPSSGTITVVNGAVTLNVTFSPGAQGPIPQAIAELFSIYSQRSDLQSEFPAANTTLAGLAELAGWAGGVVVGAPSDPAYDALAPYAAWYVLMSTYNDRPDLQAAFPGAYGDFTDFTDLVDWAGGVVNDSFPDVARTALAPFGSFYALMSVYDGRPDLQAAFPQAYTNATNYTGLVDWAGEVVNGSFEDSANSTLQPFGYYFDLMTVYDGRADLQAAFPDAFTNFASYLALVVWAGEVVNDSFVDSAASTLHPFGYFYALLYVYEGRLDLSAAFPLAFTSGIAYEDLLVWADDVVLELFVDSSYATLLPYAAEYELYA